MTSDHTLLINKIRRLSFALIFSGALNIGVLALLTYSMMSERPPTPYCELRPASGGERQTPLADYRGLTEMIAQLNKLPFQDLISRLQNTQQVENGYTERDLALSCLISFHHFDIQRALPQLKQPLQQRLFSWRNITTGENLILTVYPGLSNAQFQSIIQFAKTEQWPFTAEGLFLMLQRQKVGQNLDPDLIETFMLTPEFWTVDLLFKRLTPPIAKQKVLEMLIEGNWNMFKQFVEQQRKLQDISDARRQKLLLEYLKVRSETAAELILQTDWDFAVKKMDDSQVITLLQLLPKKEESERFAKEMLTSPRNQSVWQQASLRLYEYAGEPIPKNWNYQSSLSRFAPEKEIKAKSVEEVVVKTPQPVKQKEVKPSPKIESPIAKVPIDTKPAVAKVTAPVKPKQPQYRLYIVQEGDSLWKISRRFGVDMEVLKEKNQIQTSAIKPGTVLKIP